MNHNTRKSNERAAILYLIASLAIICIIIGLATSFDFETFRHALQCMTILDCR